MSMPTIEMQLRSYGQDLADRDRDGQLGTAQGPQSLSPGRRPWGRLALVAALVLFVAGLAGVAMRSTTRGDTATGATSSDAAFVLPPAGSSALEYGGGQPPTGGSAIYYDDPQGTRFVLFTYDQDLMGQTDEQYRTLADSLTTPATATESIEPFGTVVFKCDEGVESAARAMWAGDTRIAVLVETRGTDRPCSARIADLSRQMSELRLANQSDWQAFNLSASTTAP